MTWFRLWFVLSALLSLGLFLSLPLAAQPVSEADRLADEVRSRLSTVGAMTETTEQRIEAMRAWQSAEKLLELRPDSESWDLVTQAQFLAGLYEKALETGEDWVRRQPEDFRAHYARGRALIETYRFGPAISALERARDLARDDEQRALAGRSLGLALEKKRRYFDAFAAYAAAGDEASAQRLREEQAREAEEEAGIINVCYGADSRDEEMEEMQKEAERLEAELAALEAEYGLDADRLEGELRAQIRLAYAAESRQARREQAEAAIPTAESLHRQRPDAESFELLVQVQLMARRYEGAVATAEEWVRWQPTHPYALLLLGQSLTGLGNYEAAVSPLRRAFALAEGKEREVAGKSLGFALEKSKRLDEALAAYEGVGDEISVRRVRENQELEVEWQEMEISDEIVCIDPNWPDDEQKHLEAELRKFEEDQ